MNLFAPFSDVYLYGLQKKECLSFGIESLKEVLGQIAKRLQLSYTAATPSADRERYHVDILQESLCQREVKALLTDRVPSWIYLDVSMVYHSICRYRAHNWLHLETAS